MYVCMSFVFVLILLYAGSLGWQITNGPQFKLESISKIIIIFLRIVSSYQHFYIGNFKMEPIKSTKSTKIIRTILNCIFCVAIFLLVVAVLSLIYCKRLVNWKKQKNQNQNNFIFKNSKLYSKFSFFFRELMDILKVNSQQLGIYLILAQVIYLVQT